MHQRLALSVPYPGMVQAMRVDKALPPVRDRASLAAYVMAPRSYCGTESMRCLQRAASKLAGVEVSMFVVGDGRPLADAHAAHSHLQRVSAEPAAAQVHASETADRLCCGPAGGAAAADAAGPVVGDLMQSAEDSQEVHVQCSPGVGRIG